MFKYSVVVALLATSPLPGAELSDPMRPPTADAEVATPSKQRTLVLSGIVIGADRRIAIINDRALRVGDRIGGATIDSIDRNGVALRRDDHVVTLELDRPAARRPDSRELP